MAGGARLHRRLPPAGDRARICSCRTPTGRTSRCLQEDDGLTFDALHGARYRTTFSLTRRGDRITLSAETDGVGYPQFEREAFRLVVHGASPGSVRLDGHDVGRSGPDPATRQGEGGRFVLPNAGTGFTVEFGV